MLVHRGKRNRFDGTVIVGLHGRRSELKYVYSGLLKMSTAYTRLSEQSENARFVQSRNVRFHRGREGMELERIELSARERERLKVLQ